MPRLVLVFACVVSVLAFGCGAEEAVPDAAPADAPPPPTGTLSLSWTVTQGGVAVECADVGAVTVSLQIVPAAGGAGVVAAFPCLDGSGTSQQIPTDTYNVILGLRGGAGIIGTDDQLLGIEVVDDRDTSLGDVELAAD